MASQDSRISNFHMHNNPSSTLHKPGTILVIDNFQPACNPSSHQSIPEMMS
jgi:hypothetical protein